MTQLDLLIRPLLPSDSLESLTELIHDAYAPHIANGLRFVGTYQTVDVTAKRFASGYGLIATVADRSVGTVVIRPPQPESRAPLYRHLHTWSFGQLAVAPEFKGQGLGKALHEAALQLAQRYGAEVMALDTAAPAASLITMYESWGYRIVDTVDWRPNTNYESVIMTRSI